MIIGVPTETASDETRVALTPPVAKQLVDEGVTVCVAAGAGNGSDWSDDQYREAGCEVLDDREAVFERADVITQVRALGATDAESLDPYRDGQVVLGLLGPFGLEDETEMLVDREITAFSMELVPRISRAQSMDIVSSMDSVSGYKSVLVAAEALPRLFPMEMTAAGTVQPADVFVVGAGVAGLKAIATSERLGASTRAYDIRPEVKEEVESLGAEFVELDLETDDASDDEGHAKEQDDEFIRKQREMMNRVIADSDVVITTAAVPGRPSPELVTNEMIDGMDPGSVIVDLAAKGGGNCEPTVADEIVDYEGVSIHGPTNLPATVPHTASQLVANNVKDFLDLLLTDGELDVDTDDEIIDSTLLSHDGTYRAPHETDETDDEDDD
ncbi:Re/Si-specific NAD(P)(+) transhydrogenase subunit alpha [Natrarchaeobius chitinivorans]|uniref:proton-translocating NAD(P)(+) transhydrogenase n=1 Tax=Natrarchaeobius chitinivorans TaxID=1679083 RepID=A0A3N6LW83_NATCH|nr:Re/Si-specific NAD(P)(+) transhydrogenase subunit alpha [Natrarchaeobius chitinivorans]RQG94858.1 Re/Si-specific NAD(P)(+) transhydrogenase subunit alpha [Natrarchaeobius chitinivorans]